LRATLVRVLNRSDGFRCLSHYGSAEEALKAVPTVKPEVVLMDINLPGINGVECVRQLKQVLPNLQVMMLTVYEDTENIFSALAAGATGYLLKRTKTAELLEAIREVHRVLAPDGRAVIMLYYKNSFNYHVNLRIVRRLRAHLLKSELGIKLAHKLWREPEEELRRHADLMKQDPAGYLDMQNMLNRNTDGPDNPLSQVFTRESGSELFWQFKNVKTEVMFWNPNYLPGIGKLIPKSVENWLASQWGWHLWIYADKSTLKTATEWESRPERAGIPRVHSEAFAG